MSASGGQKAVIAALAANLGIAVSKFIAFLITGSSSMLAESAHSVVDSGNQGLLLVGAKRAKREATSDHPFGYGRDRYIYGFLVALVLFSAGGLFALYEGIHKIQDPHHIDKPQVAIGVLAVAIVLESLSFRTAIMESNHVRGEQDWIEFIRHAKVPELPVILLEDLAALIGLILALFGVGVAVITEEYVWDGIGTAAIGVLLLLVACVLIVETKSLLMGEAASASDLAKIEENLSGGLVERIIHMKTMHLGPEEILVAAKLSMPAAATLTDIANAINEAEGRVRAAVPAARVIYLEPDIYQEPKSV